MKDNSTDGMPTTVKNQIVSTVLNIPAGEMTTDKTGSLAWDRAKNGLISAGHKIQGYECVL